MLYCAREMPTRWLSRVESAGLDSTPELENPVWVAGLDVCERVPETVTAATSWGVSFG